MAASLMPWGRDLRKMLWLDSFVADSTDSFSKVEAYVVLGNHGSICTPTPLQRESRTTKRLGACQETTGTWPALCTASLEIL